MTLFAGCFPPLTRLANLSKSAPSAGSAILDTIKDRGSISLGSNGGTYLQALMGEAFNDIVRKYGKRSFGAR
jgi:hypothetical protein